MKSIVLTSAENLTDWDRFLAEDGLKYKISSDNQYVIVSACGNDKIVEALIPNEVIIDGKIYPVCEVDMNGFYKCPQLAKVSLPPNLKKIGSGAFYGCKIKVVYVNGCRNIDLSQFTNYPKIRNYHPIHD